MARPVCARIPDVRGSRRACDLSPRLQSGYANFARRIARVGYVASQITNFQSSTSCFSQLRRKSDYRTEPRSRWLKSAMSCFSELRHASDYGTKPCFRWLQDGPNGPASSRQGGSISKKAKLPSWTRRTVLVCNSPTCSERRTTLRAAQPMKLQ